MTSPSPRGCSSCEPGDEGVGEYEYGYCGFKSEYEYGYDRFKSEYEYGYGGFKSEYEYGYGGLNSNDNEMTTACVMRAEEGEESEGWV